MRKGQSFGALLAILAATASIPPIARAQREVSPDSPHLASAPRQLLPSRMTAAGWLSSPPHDRTPLSDTAIASTPPLTANANLANFPTQAQIQSDGSLRQPPLVQAPATLNAPILKPATLDPPHQSSRPSVLPAQREWVIPTQRPSAEIEIIAADPALKIGQWQENEIRGDLPVSTLHQYMMDDKAVSTVYLRDLPVISFVENGDQETPLLRASSLVAQLNQLSQSYLGNQDITLDLVESETSSDSDSDPVFQYAIRVNDQELVRIDQGILLVGTTKTPTDAALLATNRLRRLLLDAPPVQAPPSPTPPQPDPLADPALTPNPLSAHLPAKSHQQQEGYASWYDPSKYNPSADPEHDFTAAHRSLPLGTLVRVINLANGKRTVVEINGRGPFTPGRVIDISVTAAEALDMIQTGVERVRLEVLNSPQ